MKHFNTDESSSIKKSDTYANNNPSEVKPRLKEKRKEKTKEGFVILKDVIITSAGVHIYKNKNNQTEYQLKPAEEIFKEAHLKSAIGKPVTLNHPISPLNPINAKKYAVGTILSVYKKDGDDQSLHADIAIIDENAINKIDKNQQNQLSLGYSLSLKDSPGISEDGKRYDKIQTNLIVNHLALVKKSRIGEITTIPNEDFAESENQDGALQDANANKGISIFNSEDGTYSFNSTEIEKEYMLINNQSKKSKVIDLCEANSKELQDKIKLLDEIGRKTKIIDDKNKEIENYLIQIDILAEQVRNFEKECAFARERNFLENAIKIKTKLNLDIEMRNKSNIEIYKELENQIKKNYNIQIDNFEDNYLKTFNELNTEELFLKVKNKEYKKNQNKKNIYSQISQHLNEAPDQKEDPIALFNRINFQISTKKQNL
jgi:hypothetical protein